MTELEKTKYEAISVLRSLCARCKEGVEHNCPVLNITKEIKSIQGIPIKVNDQLYHVMFN